MKVSQCGLCLIALLISLDTLAQDAERKEKITSIFKDSIDGNIDLSRFLIEANGFIPVAQIITEPALGHFGLMLAPLFIKPNKVRVIDKYIPPDITAAFVGYTANKTWGLGAIRIASLPKQHLKYRVGGGYGNLNIDYYRTLPVVGEQSFAFNFKMYALTGSVLRQIGKSSFYIGIDYLFMRNKVNPEMDLPDQSDFEGDKILDSNLSSIGVDVELDKRDNVFTPDKGLYFSTDFGINASWTGSDYDFQLLNIYVFKYFKVTTKWISGFRFETRQIWGDAPFYSMPSVSLRGVPAARYQGDKTFVLETEQRYDISPRWSTVVFTGLGKAPTNETSLADATLVSNYGTGFRYLLAKKFKLRAGIDIAASNNDFGWYIIIGSAWNRRN